MADKYHPNMFQDVNESETPKLQLLANERLSIFPPNTDILDLKSQGSYRLSTTSQKLSKDNTYRALPRHQKTPLTSAFFSAKNVNNLQKLLKIKVKEITSLWIDDQSVEHLLDVMRYIYITYARHPIDFTSKDLSKQPKLSQIYTAEIKRLNDITVKYSAPRIVTELQSHLYYLRDTSTSISVLENPVNTSISGQRQYREKTDVLAGTGTEDRPVIKIKNMLF